MMLSILRSRLLPKKANNSDAAPLSAFTLIEIVIVIALMAVVYVVVFPNFGLRTASEIETTMGRLSGDVRSAFDLAVLANKPYRLVFHMRSGDYWLEQADREHFFLGDEKIRRDLTQRQMADEAAMDEDRFQQYITLAGEAVTDPETEKKIPPTSPLIKAKEKLKKVIWTKVETLEWRKRTLGPYMVVQDLQAEHHSEKQKFEDSDEEMIAVIYFFPNGYVEKAVIHVAFRLDNAIDPDQQPYTIVTDPFEGTAEIISGYEEVDVLRDDGNV